MEVSHIEGEAKDAGTAGLIEVGKKDLPRHGDHAHLGVQPLHGHRARPDRSAKEDLPLLLFLLLVPLLLPLRGDDRHMEQHLLQAVGGPEQAAQGRLLAPQGGGGRQGQGHGLVLLVQLRAGELALPQQQRQLPSGAEMGEHL